MPLILSGSAGLSGNVGNVTKDMLPAGSVLQVVQAQLTTPNIQTASLTPVDTGLVASITPLNATSKILCMASFSGGNVGAGPASVFDLLRNTTRIASVQGAYINGLANVYTYNHLSFLDSPYSVATLTYKMQFWLQGSGGNVAYFNTDYGNVSNESAQLILMEIKA